MKTMALTGIGSIEPMDVPPPCMERDTDVLLAVNAIGVCGSDVHYYATGRIGSQVVQYPFRVGHECSATVLQTGTRVTRVRPGDRVAVEPAMSCGQCDQCRANRRHTCRTLRFLGCPGQAEGCLCERIVMPEDCCYPVGATLSQEDAALIEPLAIGVYAVRQSVPMRGARIAILGSGPIGMSVLFAARAAGAERIYVTDRIAPRLACAARAGADWTGNPDTEDIVAAVREREPLLLDAAFECCGQQAALDQAVELLKPGGKLMLVGIPTEFRVSFEIDSLRRKEICIQNVRRQNECVTAAIDLLAGGKVKTDLMITHRFSFDQTSAAMALVAGYRDGVMKAMIHVNS